MFRAGLIRYSPFITSCFFMSIIFREIKHIFRLKPTTVSNLAPVCYISREEKASSLKYRLRKNLSDTGKRNVRHVKPFKTSWWKKNFVSTIIKTELPLFLSERGDKEILSHYCSRNIYQAACQCFILKVIWVSVFFPLHSSVGTFTLWFL